MAGPHCVSEVSGGAFAGVGESDVGGDLPYLDDSVDFVVSSVRFHHWPDVPAAVRELRRVVRPSGRIMIYDARIAPWRRLDVAAAATVPRTGAGWAFLRAELPVAVVAR